MGHRACNHSMAPLSFPHFHAFYANDTLPISPYPHSLQTQKKPQVSLLEVSSHSDLAVSYSHMGKPHTTIGVTAFHF